MPVVHPFPQIIDAAKKLRAAQEVFLSAPLIAWANKEHARKQGIRNFWKPLKQAFGHDAIVMQQLRNAFEIGYGAGGLPSKTDVRQLNTARGKAPPTPTQIPVPQITTAPGPSPGMNTIGTTLITSMRKVAAAFDVEALIKERRHAEGEEATQISTARATAPSAPSQITTERAGYPRSDYREAAARALPNRAAHSSFFAPKNLPIQPVAGAQAWRGPSSDGVPCRAR